MRTAWPPQPSRWRKTARRDLAAISPRFRRHPPSSFYVPSSTFSPVSQRVSWSREEVEQQLQAIMARIHRTAHEAAAAFGKEAAERDYAATTRPEPTWLPGFVRVAEAMLDQWLG